MKRFSKTPPLILLMVLAAGFTAFAQKSAEVSTDFLKNARILHAPAHHRNAGFDFAATSSSSIQGIDSVVNFVQSFNANGVDASGNPQNLWSFAMVGNPPAQGGTTHISAPVIPVSLNLLNPDGSVFLHFYPAHSALPGFFTSAIFNQLGLHSIHGRRPTRRVL